jgi:hypothetical protein
MPAEFDGWSSAFQAVKYGFESRCGQLQLIDNDINK